MKSLVTACLTAAAIPVFSTPAYAQTSLATVTESSAIASPAEANATSAHTNPTATKDFFETKLPYRIKASPELAKEINAVLHINITDEGGSWWTVDLTKESDWVTSGALGKPRMTITTTIQDLLKIHDKKLNPNMAAMQGKLKFKPMDMSLALKVGKIL